MFRLTRSGSIFVISRGVSRYNENSILTERRFIESSLISAEYAVICPQRRNLRFSRFQIWLHIQCVIIFRADTRYSAPTPGGTNPYPGPFDHRGCTQPTGTIAKVRAWTPTRWGGQRRAGHRCDADPSRVATHLAPNDTDRSRGMIIRDHAAAAETAPGRTHGVVTRMQQGILQGSRIHGC